MVSLVENLSLKSHFLPLHDKWAGVFKRPRQNVDHLGVLKTRFLVFPELQMGPK